MPYKAVYFKFRASLFTTKKFTFIITTGNKYFKDENLTSTEKVDEFQENN